jgi:hypothetical protein
MTSATIILRELLEAVAWRDDFVTQVYDEFGPAGDPSGQARIQFHEKNRSAIEELQHELGPTVDLDAALKYGLDPEVLLGAPRLTDALSTIVAFTAWRYRDLWVFIVGRFCASADASHYVIVIGATSQDDSVAEAKIA